MYLWFCRLMKSLAVCTVVQITCGANHCLALTDGIEISYIIHVIDSNNILTLNLSILFSYVYVLKLPMSLGLPQMVVCFLGVVINTAS